MFWNIDKTNNKPECKERYVWADLDCWTAMEKHDANLNQTRINSEMINKFSFSKQNST